MQAMLTCHTCYAARHMARARSMIWLCTLLLLYAGTQAMAAGVLQLSTNEIWLRPGEKAGDLYAENIGDSTLYLDITQRLLLNPGEQPEQLVPIEEIEQPTLLVVPSRLALGPGQRYRMQLKELNRSNVPRIWRVTFLPQEKVLIDAESEDGISAPLSLQIGYGALIYQMPGN